jgi:hypothetical protein
MATNIDFIVRNGLQVMGNVAVGDYANTALAPIGGMIVSGNVGIGTASVPSGNTFAAWGNTYAYGNINLGNTGTTTGIVFPDGSFQYTAASKAAAGILYDIQLNDGTGSFTANGNFLYDYNNNYLGIGTAAPLNTVSAWGNTPAFFRTSGANSDSYEIAVGNATTDGSVLGYYSGAGSIYVPYTYIANNTAGVENTGIVLTGSNQVSIGGGTRPNNPLEISGGTLIGSGWTNNPAYIAPTNGLAVQGYVGIGTTAAAYQLDVAGSANVSMNLYAGSLISYGPIQGTTIQGSGEATLNSIVSNGAIQGTTIQGSGEATLNSIVSNGAIQGTTVQGSGTATFNSIISNSTINSGAITSVGIQNSGDILTDTLHTNAAITAGNGLVVSAGGATITGNLVIDGNILLNGNTYIMEANILVVDDPIIYLAQNNPANTYDLGIVGNYNDGTYNHTGIVWNHNTESWTVFDKLQSEPGATINWNDPSLTYGNFVAGNANIAGQTASIDYTTGAIVVHGTGGVGIGGNLNVNGSDNSLAGNVYITSGASTTGPGTGALQVAGGVSIGGNLNVTGNITGGGGTVFQGYAGKFYGDASGFGALYAGIPSGYNTQPDTVLQLSSDVNDFSQLNFQNINNGDMASGDIVITADNGNNNNTYIDLGINSSTFNQGTLDRANDGFLYVAGNTITGGGNLILGTLANNDIIFGQGGADPANEVARFVYGQGLIIEQITDSNSTATGSLVLNGGAGIAGNINVGGTKSLFSGNVGIGTSSSTGVNSALSIFGNINIGNASTASGIVFPDGSFQPTAAKNTPSYGTPGTVQFAGTGNTFSGDSNNFFWDSNNLRLGIGTSTPSNTLDVWGIASFSSNVSIVGLTRVSSLISNGFITSATVQANTSVTGQVISSNTSVSGNSFVLNGNVASTSGIVSISVDSFLTTDYRTAHYIVQITDNTMNSYHSAQIMLIHDGSTVYKTEYNEIFTGGMLGNFDASIAGTVASLTFQAYQATNKTIKVIRTTISV